MKFEIIVIAVCFGTSAARVHKPKKRNPQYNFDYYQPGAFQLSEQQPQSQIKSKDVYNDNNGLTSIAQGSADQANSAVASQNAAAIHAAYAVQNSLAQSALQASATAQAALAGKRALLKNIEQQHLDAQQSLNGEVQQLQIAQRSAKSAQQSVQQAIDHVSILQQVLSSAQTSLERAKQTASGTLDELASQTKMVGTARARIDALDDKLTNVRQDFEATKHAAQNAAKSAREAQKNAANAAAQAANNGLNNQIQQEYGIESNDLYSRDESSINHFALQQQSNQKYFPDFK